MVTSSPLSDFLALWSSHCQNIGRMRPIPPIRITKTCCFLWHVAGVPRTTPGRYPGGIGAASGRGRGRGAPPAQALQSRTLQPRRSSCGRDADYTVLGSGWQLEESSITRSGEDASTTFFETKRTFPTRSYSCVLQRSGYSLAWTGSSLRAAAKPIPVCVSARSPMRTGYAHLVQLALRGVVCVHDERTLHLLSRRRGGVGRRAAEPGVRGAVAGGARPTPP